MEQVRRRAPWMRSLLLLLLILNGVEDNEANDDVKKKFSDPCSSTEECDFDGSICDPITNKCDCRPELTVTNHLDKCGVAASVNQSCFFNEQCERGTPMTECKDGVCTCRFERQAVMRAGGLMECIPIPNIVISQRYIDPAMIGILVAMFLMFITICIVLRLFSNARWRENRTIFNTPNPRLMNASLLRDTKLGHHERRGSKGSRGPSRPDSVASLPPHSPLSTESRRGSKGSSVSGASEKPKSPSHSTPMLESVAVDVQGTRP
ncbi:uncharacterized protein LOC109535435 isoform X2 [Dendroctonus ponderosae]